MNKKPLELKVEEGKTYGWCTCGKSAKMPMCDGAHKGSDIVPIKFTAEKSGVLHICACGKTKNAPYCDGSHLK